MHFAKNLKRAVKLYFVGNIHLTHTKNFISSRENDYDDDGGDGRESEYMEKRPVWKTKAVMKRAQEIQQRKLIWSKAAEGKVSHMIHGSRMMYL